MLRYFVVTVSSCLQVLYFGAHVRTSNATGEEGEDGVRLVKNTQRGPWIVRELVLMHFYRCVLS